MGHVDLVDQLADTGQEAGLGQVRPDPRVQGRGVLPLLEQDGLLAAVGLEAAREPHVDEPGLLPQQRDLLAKERVEGTDATCADIRPENADNQSITAAWAQAAMPSGALTTAPTGFGQSGNSPLTRQGPDLATVLQSPAP